MGNWGIFWGKVQEVFLGGKYKKLMSEPSDLVFFLKRTENLLFWGKIK